MLDLSLTRFSQEYHINYIHLSRSFKAQVGMSFREYLNKIRMKKAHAFILGGLDEKQTARKVGFHDEYYFASVYHNYLRSLDGVKTPDKEDRDETD